MKKQILIMIILILVIFNIMVLGLDVPINQDSEEEDQLNGIIFADLEEGKIVKDYAENLDIFFSKINNNIDNNEPYNYLIVSEHHELINDKCGTLKSGTHSMRLKLGDYCLKIVGDKDQENLIELNVKEIKEDVIVIEYENYIIQNEKVSENIVSNEDKDNDEDDDKDEEGKEVSPKSNFNATNSFTLIKTITYISFNILTILLIVYIILKLKRRK